MRYSISIDNVKSLEWELLLTDAYLFALMHDACSWVDTLFIDGEVYYWLAKTRIIKEIPLLTDKVDTIYRMQKRLVDKGLIKTVKINGKDYFNLTDKGKEWNSYKQKDNSDANPRPELQSESKSDCAPKDSNPTDNSNIYKYSNTSIIKSDFFSFLIENEVESDIADDYVKFRKSKKAPLTIRVGESLKKEADTAGYTLNDAIKICLMRGWVGFDSKWLKTPQNTFNQKTTKTDEQRQINELGANLIMFGDETGRKY